jgi:uncharacterized membrane protein
MRDNDQGLFSGFDPKPKRGVLDWKYMLTFVGTICLLRGIVSIWRHDFTLAAILLSAVVLVLVIIRNVQFFILATLLCIDVNSAITVVVEGRLDSLVAVIVTSPLIFLMVRREWRRRKRLGIDL